MTGLKFYTNPQSRGRIVRWMLEEVGQPYETVVLDYGGSMKGPDYLAINPMGKVPAIVHDGKVVTESAAICAYLADAFPDAGLAPAPADRADYYRWLFFCAGPVEAAFGNRAAGFEPTPEKQGMLGYGSFDLTIDTLEQALSGRQFVAGNRFSAADVYVGSMLHFLVNIFKQIEPRPAFTDYCRELLSRPAWVKANSLDDALSAGTNATG
jgi:glutathione S-transferase